MRQNYEKYDDILKNDNDVNIFSLNLLAILYFCCFQPIGQILPPYYPAKAPGNISTIIHHLQVCFFDL